MLKYWGNRLRSSGARSVIFSATQDATASARVTCFSPMLFSILNYIKVHLQLGRKSHVFYHFEAMEEMRILFKGFGESIVNCDLLRLGLIYDGLLKLTLETPSEKEIENLYAFAQEFVKSSKKL
jgi:hypothetical protein